MKNQQKEKEYNKFIQNKKHKVEDFGFEVERDSLSKHLFDFQKDIVLWSIKKGKCCIFAKCGLGKTHLQIEWARLIYEKTKENILIVAPLAVTMQTQRIAKKDFNFDIHICRHQEDVKEGINITNYEMLEHFDSDLFIGVVLDESSILKNYMGKRKKEISKMFRDTKYKLCCTATPSPNDNMEILNHAEYLGVMRSNEALAIWFINDTMSFGNYKLKGHAKNDFWQWVSSWAISLSKPSDLGYIDGDFKLPELKIIERLIDVDMTIASEEDLFRMPVMNATSFHKEKRLTNVDRVKETAKIVNENKSDIFCIWCDTNFEADELKKQIPEAIEVRGDDTPKFKEETAIKFIEGKIRILISKPSIFGFGLNFQVCHNVIFCGLSYSYESFYQATRRFWRFGQKKEVNLYIILGKTEKNILDVIHKKELQYRELKKGLHEAIKKFQHIKDNRRDYKMEYESKIYEDKLWKLYQGDCIEEIKKIEDESVHFQIFSPPFSSLYIYSDSYRDMGNNKNDEEFFKHFDYLIPELWRILIKGRLVAIHCKNLVDYKGRDGQSGLRDFRGDIIRIMQKHGFKYHSEVCIWKDPVIEMQRTKSHGLLYKQLRKDSSYSRQGLPDYLVIFRKWDENYIDSEPVIKTKEDYELDWWQRMASPVWFDIQQTNVLNAKIARSDEDEKHICPLQLDVIERAVHLWTNPNDIVFSPFTGIGSEGYVSIKEKRRFVGIELKEEYCKVAIGNLKEASEKVNEGLLFDMVK